VDVVGIAIVATGAVALLAPIAGALAAAWPSRATRHVGRSCLTLAVLCLVGALAAGWESARPDPAADPLMGAGRDLFVRQVLVGGLVLVGLANLAGWGAARRAVRETNGTGRDGPPRR
jgi:hypothetical protein